MHSDFWLALRTLRKSPGFAAVAGFTLALGIGVNTAMFSIVDALALRPLPYPASRDLVQVSASQWGGTSSTLAIAEYQDTRARQTAFEDLAAYFEVNLLVSGDAADPERIVGASLSASGPAMLRVPLALGRWYGPEDDKAGAP